MSAQAPQNPQNEPNKPLGATQEVNFTQASARVPEKVGRGVYSTATAVLQGPNELAIDFLLRMVPPYMLAARVIVPWAILPSMVGLLQEHWENYRNRFGSPPTPPPPPPNAVAPKISDVYDEMKLPDEVVVGAYANTLMVTYSPSEFCFDFICTLFPRPVVTCRVYMSALQVPGLLDTLKRSWTQMQSVIQQQQQHHAQQVAQQAQQRAAEGPGKAPEAKE